MDTYLRLSLTGIDIVIREKKFVKILFYLAGLIRADLVANKVRFLSGMNWQGWFRN